MSPYKDTSKKPKNKAHKGVKYWYKFKNTIIFDGIMYDVTFNIRDKGKEQYQYLIDFREIKKRTTQVSHTVKNNLRQAFELSSNERVSQKSDSVNTQSMQKSENNSQKKNSIKMNFTREEIDNIQKIGGKSVNDINSSELKSLEKFARKYYEELGTKSPFFRSWFGDWRENDKTIVTVATTKNSARGKTKNKDTGWSIQISGKVFAESQHKGKKNQAALLYLDYINDIVENAVLLDSYTSDKKDTNSLMFHSLYAVADIGNGPELLKLYVEEMNNPNSENTIKRSYQLQNIEKQQLQVRSSGNNPSSIMQSVAVKSVSDLYNLVKQNDKNFNPKPCSLVVNKDGTPKIVYHGTRNELFMIFNKWSYFTADKKYAERYASEKFGKPRGEVIESYINIKKPFDIRDKKL